MKQVHITWTPDAVQCLQIDIYNRIVRKNK